MRKDGERERERETLRSKSVISSNFISFLQIHIFSDRISCYCGHAKYKSSLYSDALKWKSSRSAVSVRKGFTAISWRRGEISDYECNTLLSDNQIQM